MLPPLVCTCSYTCMGCVCGKHHKTPTNHWSPSAPRHSQRRRRRLHQRQPRGSTAPLQPLEPPLRQVEATHPAMPASVLHRCRCDLASITENRDSRGDASTPADGHPPTWRGISVPVNNDGDEATTVVTACGHRRKGRPNNAWVRPAEEKKKMTRRRAGDGHRPVRVRLRTTASSADRRLRRRDNSQRLRGPPVATADCFSGKGSRRRTPRALTKSRAGHTTGEQQAQQHHGRYLCHHHRSCPHGCPCRPAPRPPRPLTFHTLPHPLHYRPSVAAS